MVFSSATFLFIFFPLILILNIVLPSKYRNGVLLFASLFFYAWGEPVFIVLLLVSIIMNYFCGIGIGKGREKNKGKSYLALAVVLNVLMLVIFKYANFLAESLSAISGTTNNISNIPLPLGISFFTFRAISYLVDAYRDKTLVQKKIFGLALYLSFFPQLTAGPIVRYADFKDQIEKRSITAEQISSGMRRFAIGLCKKVLIAGMIGAIADKVFAMDAAGLTTSEAWIGAVAYSLQIYFDFSAYSDMAIGLSIMFGFNTAENFNYPYIASSITDFWKRWHISLTAWFRNYVYIPLGGNREGAFRTYVNIMLVFILTGFWHGADWTFIAWGLFHGLFMVIERITGLGKEKSKVRIIGNVYTLIIVIFGFVIFRSENLAQTMGFTTAMFGKFSFRIRDALLQGSIKSPIFLITVASAAIACTPVIRMIRNKSKKDLKTAAALDIAGYAISLCLFALSLLALSMSTYNPFIYFRF